MKRFFILASAAIVALASCAKTEVVYNDAPEEIAFKTVTGVMTKANLTLDANTTMGVFANKTVGGTVEFANAEFVSNETLWHGNPVRYWPLGNAELTFAFYSPFIETSPVYDYTDGTLDISVDNSVFGSQTNWLYGATRETGSKNSPVASGKPIMKHLLAKITLKLTGAVTINSATLTGTEQKETATITYSDPATVEWTDTGAPVDMVVISSEKALSNTATTVVCYVIPSAQTSLVLNYSIGTSSPLDYTLNLSTLPNWEAGKNYIYNINVEPGEITFVPNVEAWTDVTYNGLYFNGNASVN